jgi:hypothetical protein
MEQIIMDVNWVAVIVGAVVAYGLGWFWYSPKMFATKWLAGIKVAPTDQTPMLPAMLTQAVGTFLLAWVIGVTATTDSLAFSILITVTIAVLIKANGFFSQKSKYAIMVESGYILAMVVVMIIAHAIF